MGKESQKVKCICGYWLNGDAPIKVIMFRGNVVSGYPDCVSRYIDSQNRGQRAPGGGKHR